MVLCNRPQGQITPGQSTCLSHSSHKSRNFTGLVLPISPPPVHHRICNLLILHVLAFPVDFLSTLARFVPPILIPSPKLNWRKLQNGWTDQGQRQARRRHASRHRISFECRQKHCLSRRGGAKLRNELVLTNRSGFFSVRQQTIPFLLAPPAPQPLAAHFYSAPRES